MSDTWAPKVGDSVRRKRDPFRGVGVVLLECTEACGEEHELGCCAGDDDFDNCECAVAAVGCGNQHNPGLLPMYRVKWNGETSSVSPANLEPIEARP